VNPLDLDLFALAEALRRGELGPLEVTRTYLDRIQAEDPRLGAFLGVPAEKALARARDLEALPPSDRGLLHGVPFAWKDNLHLAGEPLTCGSRILQGYVAPYTATCLERLLAAGAVPLGRTNMDEFAMGSSTETSAFGPTRNPWDPARVPGGSSGGSAAAVAARLAPAALGSDTGGSIRQPAALCGITGLKPTYGRVSRYGLVAFGSSLDQVGPLCRTARDAGLLLAAMGGPDPRDPTTLAEPLPSGLAAISPRAEGLRLGLLVEHMGETVEEGVRERVREALAVLEDLGVQIREVRLPLAEYALPAYYLASASEASSNLARFDGIHYGLRVDRGRGLHALYEATREAGFGREVKRRILLGTFCLSRGYYDAWYKKALQARTLLGRAYEELFREVDVLAGPTSPHRAFPLGEKLQDPVQMYLCDSLTAGANLAGLPALSLPCGFAGGLPVGLQLTGPPLSEERLLSLGAAFQEATDHHLAEPKP